MLMYLFIRCVFISFSLTHLYFTVKGEMQNKAKAEALKNAREVCQSDEYAERNTKRYIIYEILKALEMDYNRDSSAKCVLHFI